MNKIDKTQRFCLEVEKLASKYKLSFFLVTEGASITRNNNCEPVSNARKAHIEWEKKHNINSREDWLNEKKATLTT